jgi:hypothetical protein
MAGIGIDIADVMDELGVSATILRSPTNLTEKINTSIKETADPFTQEYEFDASFKYNTVIVPGDVIQMLGTSYIVMNKTGDLFEGEVVEYAAGLYKCNTSSTALLLSPTSSVNQTTFVVTSGWSIKKSPAYGFVYKGKRGVSANEETSPGKETTYTLYCLVPASYGAMKLDRFQLSPTEYYRVEDVETYQYAGVHVLSLVEDERVVYVP